MPVGSGIPDVNRQALLKELPVRWEKLGDLALLPADCMTSAAWARLAPPPWAVIADALGVARLARQARIASTGALAGCCSMAPCDAPTPFSLHALKTQRELVCVYIRALPCEMVPLCRVLVPTPVYHARLQDAYLRPSEPPQAPRSVHCQGRTAAFSAFACIMLQPVLSGTRDSQAQLVLGASSWVQHRENGIMYALDACLCMFSSGNVTERARMGQLRCTGETVVDLFAGIGYYTLPVLVHAGVVPLISLCRWGRNNAGRPGFLDDFRPCTISNTRPKWQY